MPAKPIPASDIQVALGAGFRRVRKQHGFTLEDLRKGLQISINTLRWHEAGARSLRLDQIVEAARIMGCETVELVQIPQPEEAEEPEELDGPDAA